MQPGFQVLFCICKLQINGIACYYVSGEETHINLNMLVNRSLVHISESFLAQGLLLLIQLTKGNANIQKIVAFENALWAAAGDHGWGGGRRRGHRSGRLPPPPHQPPQEEQLQPVLLQGRRVRLKWCTLRYPRVPPDPTVLSCQRMISTDGNQCSWTFSLSLARVPD